MLSPAVPATATLHTSTSSAIPSSPTRPSSRLRGLSYLRTYTREHLHPSSTTQTTHPYSRPDPPPLTRSTSSPVGSSFPTRATTARIRPTEPTASDSTSGIQNGENGWLPTVQGRSGLTRESPHPTSTSTESAAPEPSPSMTRTRTSTTTSGPTPSMPATIRRQTTTDTSSAEPSASLEPTSSNKSQPSPPTIRFLPHLDPRTTHPSLNFSAMTRTLKAPQALVRVGRYSERDHANTPDPNALPIGFKSKVVSRRHCEFWYTPTDKTKSRDSTKEGQWWIKDVKSSSGTFLNHVRLSAAGQESRPYEVNDGDTIQLGIDFKGGEEPIFRCVKIRIECNRDWQKGPNSYNTTAHRKLLKNAGVLQQKHKQNLRDPDSASLNGSSECSICLNTVAPCQALFVAPCSHVWHYKCVRNLIHGPNYPNFLCPNCRFMADLEADVEPEDEYEVFDEEDDEGVEAEAGAEGEAGQQRGTDAPQADRNGGEAGDLADLLHRTALDSGAGIPAFSPADGQADESKPHSSPSLISKSSTTTKPIAITANPTRAREPPPPSAGTSSMTPTTTTLLHQFASASGISIPEGPMTPRNDFGPFVLDGSAGRDSRSGGRPAVPALIREASGEAGGAGGVIEDGGRSVD
ncbi:hypothetical protein LTR62_002782 [Meristemomyces frigidus]|uniref:Uncharacterized protein n=1 Tax=Meristemomyces frigidus TaxID=1508187 RepID=A0AAN7T7D8_9PEZI|nr:hypothetical protein LTR62_002782 [Meristemomyces frigidus]